MLTALIDYESGNLHSALKAFEKISSENSLGSVTVTNDPEIISNADEALSLWSSVIDYNMTNDEYPEDAEETCNAYYDALILLKESNCTTDLEYLSSEDIEDLRLNQCDIQ